MNEHLDSVFTIILPALENAGIEYWVYGGVGLAGCAGKFVRNNKDVDSFVLREHFEDACRVLGDICIKNGFNTVFYPEKNNEKPKIEVMIGGKEIFSVIAVYKEGENIIFRYGKGDEIYGLELLGRFEKNVGGYRFFTPPLESLEEIFSNHMKSKPDKVNRKSYKIDAETFRTLSI